MAKIIDHLLSSASIRRWIWKTWYPYLTRRLREEDVLFLNYAYVGADLAAARLPLAPADEPNRGCIQLYHHVASLTEQSDPCRGRPRGGPQPPSPLHNKQILEISSGHGGGASYLTRTFDPATYTALDLNPEAIAFCKRRHQIPNLTFLRGDACNLPFPDKSFDVVLNVEASHCYPDFLRFLREVARVLRPGGHFHYADFRFKSGIPEWERDLASAPLHQLQTRGINEEVLRGMEMNSDRSTALIVRHLPKFLHALGRDFAGIKGSRIHKALKEGEISYRSYCFVRDC